MNKLFVLFALSACFVATYAQEDDEPIEGGYTKSTYDSKTEAAIYNLAVSSIIALPENSQVNAVPHLDSIYTQVVSGINYKLVIRFGSRIYQAVVYSQPWTKTL